MGEKRNREKKYELADRRTTYKVVLIVKANPLMKGCITNDPMSDLQTTAQYLSVFKGITTGTTSELKVVKEQNTTKIRG